MKSNKANIFFIISLIAAIWFLLTSWCWFYILNIWISFPFGILALVLWKKGLKTDPDLTRFKIIPIVLICGTLTSIASLVYILWINN